MHIGICIEETPGCCGVLQIYGFTYYCEYDHHACVVNGDDETDACTKVFNNITNPEFFNDDGWRARVVQIWFVKKSNYDGNFNEHYDREPLRQLIANMPGVVDLGEHYNPNSNNKIHGYQWEVK